MKLLLISSKSENAAGGIAVWTEHFLAHCEHNDISCHLVNTEISARRVSSGARRLWNEFLRTCRIFKRLNNILKDHTFDIAHLNTSCGPTGLYRDYLVARRLAAKGIPFALHYHCDIPFWIQTKGRRHILRKMASMASLNIVLCENSRMFLENLGISAVKVPNFIQEASLATEQKNINDSLANIFFVGRISRNKGAAEIYKLAKRFPDKVFTLAGTVIPPVDSWEKPDNVHLIGTITHDQVLLYLDKSDLFLFPSHSEGFSMALMEAMARGVPCVAYDSVGANGDMLADNCGIAVPFGNIHALAQSIELLEDPSIRRSISCNALEKVQRFYTTDAVMALFKTLYENCL